VKIYVYMWMCPLTSRELLCTYLRVCVHMNMCTVNTCAYVANAADVLDQSRAAKYIQIHVSVDIRLYIRIFLFRRIDVANATDIVWL